MATRFLIVRLDGLGDTVLTTPLLRAIRTHWRDAHVTVVASPAGHACLEGHPGVDALITFSPQSTSLPEKIALGRQLARGRFDVTISATEKAWGYIWGAWSRAPRRIGFWAGAQKPLKSMAFRPTLTDRIEEVSDAHEAERHMRLLEPLGVSDAPGPLWLPASPGPGEGPVALHLSTKWLQDGYDESWLSALVDQLADAHPLVLTAGALEGAWAKAFCARLPRHRGIETVLDVSFAEWTQTLARCRHLVSMDTGAVHVGAALKLPVIDVFPRAGADRCVPRWKPWMVPHAVVLRDPRVPSDDGMSIVQEIVAGSRKMMGE